MPGKNYLIYDIETSGLNGAFDQVLQFAAILVDEDFSEIERYEWRARLNPDVIVSPEAMLICQFNLNDLLSDENENDYTVIKKIHHLLNKPNTISLGYNTLGFDDEFLRFSFYKNLLEPYTHQYKNGCGRFDLYPMLAMYYLFKPEIIEWPEFKEKVSLKLENLNKVNKWVSGNSHDAMVDVEATLALAKEMRKEKEMWEYLIGFFDKETTSKRIQQLPKAPLETLPNSHLGLYFEGRLGFDNAFQAPVLCLGSHYTYKNQTLWLRLDDPNLQDYLNGVKTAEDVWVFRKKGNEPGFILPADTKHKRYLTSERENRMQLNLTGLQENSNKLGELVEYHRSYQYPVVENVDVSAKLYQKGFYSFDVKDQCARFNCGDINQKMFMLRNFSDPEVRVLAARILGRMNSEYLQEDDSDNEEFGDYLRCIFSEGESSGLIDYRGNERPSAGKVLQQIDELLLDSELNEADCTRLQDLANYLQERISFCPQPTTMVI